MAHGTIGRPGLGKCPSTYVFTKAFAFYLSLLSEFVFCMSCWIAIRLCGDIYQAGTYTFYCPNPNDFVFIVRTTTSFTNFGSENTCAARVGLVFNNSIPLTQSVCNTCFKKQPCVLDGRTIDGLGLFAQDTYRINNPFNPTPMSVEIFYKCISE